MKAIELKDRYRTLLHRHGMTSPRRLQHFFAQLHHESQLEPLSENLNYSSSRLRKVFGKRHFPSQSIADDYHRKPEEIANRVYANRMGNGPECSGDGWKYRGRGFIQLTGKDNYRALSNSTGIDYLNNPDLLLNEADAMIAALWFWTENRLNKYADMDNVDGLTRRINGGTNGLDHRKKLTRMYESVFN